MPDPLVFVNILTWNRAEEVLGAVRSLARLQYDNYVPLVIDNASADRTVAALAEQFPAVKVIENPKNLGYTGGNNEGIRYALAHGADYVMLLNNDARVSRGLLRTLVDVMESAAEIGVVGPKNLYERDPDRIWGAWASVTYGSNLTEIAGRHQLDGPEFAGLRDVEQVMGCGYMWRRPALEDVGLLDTDFFGYHEDVDWCVRATKKGWRVVYCGDAVVYHDGGTSNDPRYEFSMPVKYFLGRNAVLFGRKHASAGKVVAIIFNALRGSFRRARRARRQKRPSRELQFVHGVIDGILGRNSQPDFRVD